MSTFLRVDVDEPYCNRAKLDTGTQCNYSCWFCYYQDRLNVTTSFNVIKSRIDYLVGCGISEVDLSGGESSIHKNWFDILDYCKHKGLGVSTVSNGSMFCDYEFLRKSKECGLGEILFSLHGFDDKSHDVAVGVVGAFKSIIKSIENSNKLGVLVRINCVVSSDNFHYLHDRYVDLIHSFDCLEVNFLTLNFWGNTDIGESQIVDYRVVSESIKKSIDRLNVKYINVRYIPYCFMVGYEKYVCNVYQHIYDIYDWNMAVYGHSLSPEMYITNELKCLYDAAEKDRVFHYYKPRECLKCKYFLLCDGLENSIKSHNVYPVIGDMIKDVNYYREGFYEDKCFNTNSQ